MVALQVASPIEEGGLGSGVVYFDTENSFSPSRLVEMAEARFAGDAHLADRAAVHHFEYFNLSLWTPRIGGFRTAESLKTLMTNVIVYQDATVESLLHRYVGFTLPPACCDAYLSVCRRTHEQRDESRGYRYRAPS